jgi:NAD(P)-dependent dehydrogenase (short-subunit alcohol dehydrogenase family)
MSEQNVIPDQVDTTKSKLEPKDLETCLKVLEFLNKDREMLQDENLKAILEKGKQLFQPRTYFTFEINIRLEEKKKIRKQRKAEKKYAILQQKQSIVKECGMKQKKDKEKNDYWEHLKQLPPKGLLEGKPEVEVCSTSDEEDEMVESTDLPQDPSISFSCYACGKKYLEVHHFYDRMCADCAELNWTKRNQTCDLKGRVAIVTGGRVKIGYEISLILLRQGASVIVTSRFPKDTSIRYSKEKDFDEFKDRIHVYGLDMRHIPSVIDFTDFIKSKYDRLDILINNAAQTIRRPPIFYEHLKDIEMKPLIAFDETVRKMMPTDFQMKSESPPLLQGKKEDIIPIEDCSTSAQLSFISTMEEDLHVNPKEFPEGALDVNGQQIDLRQHNTWDMELSEVPLIEFLEVQAINQTAPFILCSRLKSLMIKVQDQDKWVINVSAMEGQFYRLRKTTKHPHTNMQKAALNMMTRTCGADFAKDRIYMNSVDTGWVTDESIVGKSLKNSFTAPIDEKDGAMRCCDPIFIGVLTGKNEHSKFYKDYKKELW